MMNTINTKMTKSDCLDILRSKENIWFYYSQALYTKTKNMKNRIRLNTLLNAKSGLCDEDCGYCARCLSI